MTVSRRCSCPKLHGGAVRGHRAAPPIGTSARRDRMIPGGSSGGTAVAPAARMMPGGIGTDTGGSVRVPAAPCGVAGFRPSVGRYSGAGIIPISHTRDTAGPVARTGADLRLLDAVMARTGGRPRAPRPADRLIFPRMPVRPGNRRCRVRLASKSTRGSVPTEARGTVPRSRRPCDSPEGPLLQTLRAPGTPRA